MHPVPLFLHREPLDIARRMRMVHEPIDMLPYDTKILFGGPERNFIARSVIRIFTMITFKKGRDPSLLFPT